MLSPSSNINNTFFEGLYKHAWKSIIPPGLTEAEIDFIEEIAALKKGDEVLDIMCGYGRHALELAKRGFAVIAIDNLSDYIDEIKINAEHLNLPIHAIRSDVLNTSLDRICDAAICMGNSFAFFDRKDAITILKNISAHLKKGGVFIINTWMIAEIALKHFKEKDWNYAGEYKCLLEYKYSSYPSKIESEQTIISPQGIVETVKGVDYIFTLDQLELMFNEAGLKTKDVYGTPRKKKFTLGDGRAYIVAIKVN